MEDCPREEDLNILTDSLSAMKLLSSMQRKDFPLSLYRHPVRQLLVHVVRLLKQRAEVGRTTRFIKIRAHRGEPLNEAADAMASEAGKFDPARAVALDQDPEAVYFLMKQWSGKTWFSEQQSNASLALSDRGGGGGARRPRLPRSLSWHPGCCCLIRAEAHWAACWER